MSDPTPTMIRAQLEGLGSLLLSVQNDCIRERKRAELAETNLAKVLSALDALWEGVYEDGAPDDLLHSAEAILEEFRDFR